MIHANYLEMTATMRSALYFVFFSALLLVVTGCGPDRPDPRDNPDFNEAAWSDPSVNPMGSSDPAKP